MISRVAQERIVKAADEGERSGATVVLDGRCPSVEGYEEGFFVGPTIFDGVTPEMSLAREEIFGPVLSVADVGSLQEAIERINASPATATLPASIPRAARPPGSSATTWWRGTSGSTWAWLRRWPISPSPG